MSNNLIYGGIVYPDNPFVFDKIYNSYADASIGCIKGDSILIGRYILIKYHPSIAYTFDDQLKIIGNPSVTGDEAIWRDNYLKDNPVNDEDNPDNDEKDAKNYGNYDTVVCQKQYNIKRNIIEYVPIAHLGTSYSTEYVDNRIGDLGINENTQQKITVKAYIDNVQQELLDTDKNINDQIQIWVGNNETDKNKSIRAIAAEEIAEQLIPDSAQESLDTLQEISNWIQQHPDDVAEMNKNIATNAQNIAINSQNIVINANAIRAINEELDDLTFIEVVEKRPDNINDAIATLIYSELSENQQYRNLYIIEVINGTRQWKLVGHTAILNMQWQTF